MKEPHMFLSVIVPGPKNPKHKDRCVPSATDS